MRAFHVEFQLLLTFAELSHAVTGTQKEGYNQEGNNYCQKARSQEVRHQKARSQEDCHQKARSQEVSEEARRRKSCQGRVSKASRKQLLISIINNC
jgi:hypothetical protein